MKLSVSLPGEDVEFLDAYANEQGFASRSAVLHKAVRLLRGAQLGAAYEEAFVEWGQTGEGEVWEAAVGDGLAADAAS
ncbi:MAG TPA: ribbon-helix-helix domain-containing protein [Acidimicrobiales bacterium]|jgi:Arc/MetJ-type ribon-helix-helix transcriptional regulator|nr:ribbon-helix-helix domain-containing protein [Acidimicrobiales bacterium]